VHFPEKWMPVSEKEMRQRNNVERIPFNSNGMRSGAPLPE
jgi:hypothetical protein